MNEQENTTTETTAQAIETATAPAKQNRWKSKVLWTAIAAQVIALLQLTGTFKALGLDTGLVGNVVAGILQLLVLLGILQDPTNPTGY